MDVQANVAAADKWISSSNGGRFHANNDFIITKGIRWTYARLTRAVCFFIVIINFKKNTDAYSKYGAYIKTNTVHIHRIYPMLNKKHAHRYTNVCTKRPKHTHAYIHTQRRQILVKDAGRHEEFLGLAVGNF